MSHSGKSSMRGRSSGFSAGRRSDHYGSSLLGYTDDMERRLGVRQVRHFHEKSSWGSSISLVDLINADSVNSVEETTRLSLAYMDEHNY